VHVDDKILGLLESAQSMQRDTLPLEKEAIVSLLKTVPSYLQEEFSETMVGFANNFLVLSNIFSLDPSSFLFQHLIKGLDSAQTKTLDAMIKLLTCRATIENPTSCAEEICMRSLEFADPLREQNWQ
jgi:hypothetical protein